MYLERCHIVKQLDFNYNFRIQRKKPLSNCNVYDAWNSIIINTLLVSLVNGSYTN